MELLADQARPAYGRLSVQPIIFLLLFLALFAGFQGGRYVFSNRLQELGILSALLLFLLGGWQSMFRLDRRMWQSWLVLPVVFLGGIMVLWSSVFAVRFSDNALYSFFASREFLLGFIGPAVYLLYHSGFSQKKIESAVLCVLVALMLNYLYFYNTMDLRKAFFSGDHTVSNLVTYDEWRGFRLKPPTFALMMSLLTGFMLLIKPRSFVGFMLGVLLLSLASHIWSIVLFRSTLATLLLSVAIYPFLLRARWQWRVALVFSPLLLLVVPVLIQMASQHFIASDGGSIRMAAYKIALQHIPEFFLLGAGEDNAYGRSYQTLFGAMFYPSDLGLVGIWFKYGTLGLGLYLFMHFKILLSLLQVSWSTRKRAGNSNPLLWSMLIFATAQTFNLVLNPGLAYAQGITLGSLSLAMAAIWRDALSSEATPD